MSGVRTALVVGGTGPTGPHILQGLLDRGFDVSIFHRGAHEPPDLPDVRHIHGDPHFKESIAEVATGSDYDIVVAAYGRTALLAEAFSGRTGHFLAIGGMARYAGFNEPHRTMPSGLTAPVREEAPLATVLAPEGSRAIAFAHKLVATEAAVLASQPQATCLIYPVVYGPRNLVPWEWSVIRRVLDGRKGMILPDDGLAYVARGAARNMAQFVLLAVDQPAVSAGQIYNCVDDQQYTLRQFAELIVDVMGARMEIVGVPRAVSPYFHSVYIPTAETMCPHSMLSNEKARTELGYRDLVSTREALEESVAWYRDHPIDTSTPIPAYFDTFDYDLEDRLIDIWSGAVSDLRNGVSEPETEDLHPMPHPRQANLRVDERGR